MRVYGTALVTLLTSRAADVAGEGARAADSPRGPAPPAARPRPVPAGSACASPGLVLGGVDVVAYWSLPEVPPSTLIPLNRYLICDL